MNELPVTWAEMSREEQLDWFSRYWLDYIADGETAGLRKDAPEVIHQAWQTWMQQA
ncbi:MAG: hypothetical protein IKG53_00320 [Solobacterium sp.]|jgi:hypothetical protein|nr:hypothetical protein [Solobacterium sp.]